jgi:hypothetical protein
MEPDLGLAMTMPLRIAPGELNRGSRTDGGERGIAQPPAVLQLYPASSLYESSSECGAIMMRRRFASRVASYRVCAGGRDSFFAFLVALIFAPRPRKGRHVP